MKKSGFLTFCCAFVPGAGQMYQGYMKRGLSLITFFCLSIVFSAIFSYAAVLCPIIWMYSFFDTFNIRNGALMEPDHYLLSEGKVQKIREVLYKRPMVSGGLLLLLGAWVLFDAFVAPVLYEMAVMAGVRDLYYYTFYRNLPTLVIGVLVIYAGFRLAFGKHTKSNHHTSDPFEGGIYHE